jgi:hypothetical protein
MHEEIKSGLNLGNACHLLVQNNVYLWIMERAVDNVGHKGKIRAGLQKT